MVLKTRYLNAGVGALFASHFLAFGLYLPFLPLVLEQRGLTSEFVGFILGISLFVRILASPVMTNLSDRTGRRRFSIFIYSAVGSLVPVLMYLAPGAGTAALCVIILSVFWAPIVPLCDAYALDAVKKAKADYGKMRLWGSLAFIGANIGGGYLVVSGPSDPVLLWIAAATLLTGVVALSLPGMAEGGEEAKRQPTKEKADIFRKPWFWMLIATAGVLQGTHAAFYGFSTLYWTSVGLDTSVIGILWSLGVAAEVVLFLAAARLATRISPYSLLILAAAAGIIRWSLFPFAQDVLTIAALQVLHGLTFGAAHLGLIAIMGRIVPSDWAGTGQGFLSTFAGVMTAAGMALSGPLYALAPAYAFWLMAAASATAFAVLLGCRGLFQRRIGDTNAA